MHGIQKVSGSNPLSSTAFFVTLFYRKAPSQANALRLCAFFIFGAEDVVGIEQCGELTGIDPEALDTMATIQRNLVAAKEWAEKEARDWAAIEQAGIDEPLDHAVPQAAAKAEAAQDADLEI